MPTVRPRPTFSGALTDADVDTALEQFTAELASQHAARLADLAQHLSPEDVGRALREERWAAYVRAHPRVTELEAARAAWMASSQLHADQTAAMVLLDHRPPLAVGLRDAVLAERSKLTGTLFDLRRRHNEITLELGMLRAIRRPRRWMRDRIGELEQERERLEQELSAGRKHERQLTARLAAVGAHDNRVWEWEHAHHAALQRGLAAHRELAIREDLTIADATQTVHP